MKHWEKILHQVQQLPQALAVASKWNEDFPGFGRRLLEAKAQRGYTTYESKLEIRNVLQTRIAVIHTDEGPVKVLMKSATYETNFSEGRVMQRSFVTKARDEKFGRSAMMQLNRYSKLLAQLEFTHEVLLTNAQRKYIEDVMLTDCKSYGHIEMAVRRKDTGATAIYIREGTKHIILFEDGTTTKREHIPEFGGSWFFNKKVKRSFIPAQVHVGTYNPQTQQFSLQAL